MCVPVLENFPMEQDVEIEYSDVYYLDTVDSFVCTYLHF